MGGGREERLGTGESQTPERSFSPVPLGHYRGSFLTLLSIQSCHKPRSLPSYLCLPFSSFFLPILQPPDLAPAPQLPQAMEIADGLDGLLKANVTMVEQSSQNTLSIQAVAWESCGRKENSFFRTIGCLASTSLLPLK